MATTNAVDAARRVAILDDLLRRSDQYGSCSWQDVQRATGCNIVAARKWVERMGRRLASDGVRFATTWDLYESRVCWDHRQLSMWVRDRREWANEILEAGRLVRRKRQAYARAEARRAAS